MLRQALLGSLGAVALAALPSSAHAACANADLQMTASSDAATIDLVRRAVTCLTNQERVRYGLAPLVANEKLQKAAQLHSEDMVARNYFSHDTPEGKPFADRITAQGYTWGSASENIAAGQSTAREAVNGWMLSTGHCTNILSPDPTETSVGLKKLPPEKNNGFGANWTQLFARPVDEDAPSSDTGPQGKCPVALGPDEEGPGNDGTGPAGAQSPYSPAKVRVRRVGSVRVVARAFGPSVEIGGVLSSGAAGRRVSITVSRYGRSARRSLLTGSSGSFSARLRIPKRKKGVRGSGGTLVTVSVGDAGKPKPSLPGGVGTVG